MNKKAKQDISDVIYSEGLDYALREYTSVFTDAKDKKLNKLVEDYNKLVEEIEEYLDLDEDNDS